MMCLTKCDEEVYLKGCINICKRADGHGGWHDCFSRPAKPNTQMREICVEGAQLKREMPGVVREASVVRDVDDMEVDRRVYTMSWVVHLMSGRADGKLVRLRMKFTPELNFRDD